MDDIDRGIRTFTLVLLASSADLNRRLGVWAPS